MAAVLTFGPGAVLSHTSAAALWGLLRPTAGDVHVAIANRNGRKRRMGIHLHRLSSLTPDECTRRHGIPVTTPARTVADLRGVVPERLRRRAIRQAELAGFDLESAHAGDRSRSDLEADFLKLCRRHRIPAPEVNVRIGRWTVDFLWPEVRLVVETDSYAYHRGRIAFQDDRARDLFLRGRGFDVIRVSERQLGGDAAAVAAVLKRALTRPAAS
jgi:very-short-patch-repair endonuclease